MRLFDIHAHYNDRRFENETEGGAEKLLSSLFSENVGRILGAAVSTKDSEEVLALAEKFPGYYAAVGVHPENCGEETGVENAMERLKVLLKHEKAVAIGEIGLDYHWQENPPKEVQKQFFEAQLQLAREMGYPVIIHDRDAHGDIFDILNQSQFRDVVAVLHSYSGSPEMARQYLRTGERYISFSGVVTYKNAVQTVETAKIVPLDRLLTETDCPYLAPVPFRGKLNHSGLMIKTVERLAEIKNTTPETVAEAAFQNACRLLRIF